MQEQKNQAAPYTVVEEQRNMAAQDVTFRNLVCGGSIPAGGTTPTNKYGQGFTVSAAVAGVSTITLPAPGVPAGESYMQVCAQVGQAQIADTSATVKTVTCSTAAGVATNEPYFFEIWQITPAP
jgi:hypothetical protein